MVASNKVTAIKISDIQDEMGYNTEDSLHYSIEDPTPYNN